MAGSDLAAERTALAAAYRQLAGDGLLKLSAGNLSIRAGDFILVTPTGADSAVTPDAMVLIDQDGRVADGSGGIPSSEWSMHAAIYAARPDAGAIVHTHSDACTALSCLRRPIPAFHYMVAFFGGDAIPCAPYAHFGSPELGRHAAEALGESKACLLANHGMVAFGTSIAAAAKAAAMLEMLAVQYILALQAGEPHFLSVAEMAEARRRYGFYGHSRIENA
jgi:L-fuculose-phosphate aldolase